MFALLGVTLGTAVGVLPGIGPAMTVALLLPLTYPLDPAAALIVFAGIASRLRHGPVETVPVGGRWMTRDFWARSWKRPEEFGKSTIEGVTGPEAANNAAAAGVLVPLLTLGLPTSATAAIVVAAFQSYGIQPGPLLFQNNSGMVWALIASLYIGKVMLLVLNLPLVKIWVKVLQIPRPYLFAALGVYAVNFAVEDLAVLLVIGALGFTAVLRVRRARTVRAETERPEQPAGQWNVRMLSVVRDGRHH